MMINLQNPEIHFAIEAVTQASQLVKQVQNELVNKAVLKDDRSPVTVADYASQAIVSYMLIKAFPNDHLVAEEDASRLKDSQEAGLLAQIHSYLSPFLPGVSPGQICPLIDRGISEPGERFWTLDPIDGTKGFLRGDQYAVALALIEDGKVQLAALGCPNLPLSRLVKPGIGYGYRDINGGAMVIAARGAGTWVTSLNSEYKFTRLSVSSLDKSSQARILCSLESGHTDHDQIGSLSLQLGVMVEPVRMDSQAKYAMLAAGQGDLYLRMLSPTQPDYNECIWDQAAGSLVVEEAGGKVTDLDGKALDFSAGRRLIKNRGILASNRHLHDVVLNILRR